VTTSVTATADVSPRPGDPAPTARASLLRAELHRITARRFIRLLVVLAVLAFLVISAIAATQFSRPTPQLLAEAEQERERVIAEQERFRQECLAQPGLPPGEEELACGPPARPEDFRAEDFLDKSPFVLADALPPTSIAVGAATAALLFLIGATYVGAEWSTRSIVALLFWEPRRMRVVLTKILVTVLAAVVLGVLAQLAWLGVAALLAATRGSTGPLPAGFWGDLLAQQGRTVLLGVFAALLGFGIANLIRNTGASLGVGFVYFAVIESAIRGLRPTWQEWLLTDNAAALVLDGGHRIFIFDDSGQVSFDEAGNVIEGAQEIVVSNLHGGLVLGLTAAAVLALGTVLFQRRDLH
jgi:ABC-2 type transport system permease protein